MSELCSPHHWIQADYEQPWHCCRCGAEMPEWKSSNRPRAGAGKRVVEFSGKAKAGAVRA